MGLVNPICDNQLTIHYIFINNQNLYIQYLSLDIIGIHWIFIYIIDIELAYIPIIY